MPWCHDAMMPWCPCACSTSSCGLHSCGTHGLWSSQCRPGESGSEDLSSSYLGHGASAGLFRIWTVHLSHLPIALDDMSFVTRTGAVELCASYSTSFLLFIVVTSSRLGSAAFLPESAGIVLFIITTSSSSMAHAILMPRCAIWTSGLLPGGWSFVFYIAL